MKHLARATLALALLSAVILGACSEGPVGIFESLSLETPIDNGTEAFASQTPNFVVRFGSDYYAGVGALWRRPVTGETWSKVSGTPAALALSAAVAAGKLYVLFNDTTGVSPSIQHTADGTSWTSLDTSGVAGSPLRIFSYGTNLVAYGKEVTATEPYASAGRLYIGESFTAQDSAARSGLDIYDLADDGSGSFHAVGAWLDGATFESALSVDGTVFVNETGQPSANLRGVVYDLSVGGYIMAAADGKLYRRNAPNDWSVTAAALKNASGVAAVLTDLVVVPAAGGGNAVLVGSQSFGATNAAGYFEFDADSFAAFGSATQNAGYDLVSTLTNFQTTLEGKSVMKFHYDAVAGRLFALTGGDGLWSNAWNGTAWSGWNRE